MMHQPPVGREALIAYVVGLSVACPLTQDNPSDCPLNPIRRKSLRERYAWAKSLSDDELKQVALHHCTCLEEKTKALG